MITQQKTQRFPAYTISNSKTKTKNKSKFVIELRDVEKVAYRVVASVEQFVEPISDAFYLVVKANNYDNIGFRFRAIYHIVKHKRLDNFRFQIILSIWHL